MGSMIAYVQCNYFSGWCSKQAPQEPVWANFIQCRFDVPGKIIDSSILKQYLLAPPSTMCGQILFEGINHHIIEINAFFLGKKGRMTVKL